MRCPCWPVLSPAASPPYAEKEADAVAAARLINDGNAELAAKYPGRFAAVVSLPLPHIDAALRDATGGIDIQLARALGPAGPLSSPGSS